MKFFKFIIVLFLPIVILAQGNRQDNILPKIYSFNPDSLKEVLVKSTNFTKLSSLEIDSIVNHISKRRADYYKLTKEIKESILFDTSGKPISKANPETIGKYHEIQTNTYFYILKLIGSNKTGRLKRFLIDYK